MIAFVLHFRVERSRQAKRVDTDDRIFNFSQGSGGPFATIRFVDSHDAIFALELNDGAKGVGSMQSIGASERRISDRDRVHPEVFDFHWRFSLKFVISLDYHR